MNEKITTQQANIKRMYSLFVYLRQVDQSFDKALLGQKH